MVNQRTAIYCSYISIAPKVLTVGYIVIPMAWINICHLIASISSCNNWSSFKNTEILEGLRLCLIVPPVQRHRQWYLLGSSDVWPEIEHGIWEIGTPCINLALCGIYFTHQSLILSVILRYIRPTSNTCTSIRGQKNSQKTCGVVTYTTIHACITHACSMRVSHTTSSLYTVGLHAYDTSTHACT